MPLPLIAMACFAGGSATGAGGIWAWFHFTSSKPELSPQYKAYLKGEHEKSVERIDNAHLTLKACCGDLKELMTTIKSAIAAESQSTESLTLMKSQYETLLKKINHVFDMAHQVSHTLSTTSLALGDDLKRMTEVLEKLESLQAAFDKSNDDFSEKRLSLTQLQQTLASQGHEITALKETVKKLKNINHQQGLSIERLKTQNGAQTRHIHHLSDYVRFFKRSAREFSDMVQHDKDVLSQSANTPNGTSK